LPRAGRLKSHHRRKLEKAHKGKAAKFNLVQPRSTSFNLFNLFNLAPPFSPPHTPGREQNYCVSSAAGAFIIIIRSPTTKAEQQTAVTSNTTTTTKLTQYY
jgi:hypothetical protein